MAEYLDCETNPSKIFQLLGKTLTNSTEYNPPLYEEDLSEWDRISAYSSHASSSSLSSDDSGVGGLSSDDVDLQLNLKEEIIDDDGDDISLILDDTDLAIVSEFIGNVKPESLENESMELPEFHDGLNLPILPKLGLESDETLMTSQTAGSCGDNEDTESDMDCSDGDDYKPPNKKGCKNILLWKFLLSSLANSKSADDIVRWENKRNGVFKFMDTVKISQLWGNQKKKSGMNFEKLSRGIRHYYRTGLMSRVEGRRLVYQFNWKRVPKCYRQMR